MKRIMTAAAFLFAANVGATDVYNGLAQGNTDLVTQRLNAEDFVGVQPSIGDSVERYQGLAEGNPDLFKADRDASDNDTAAPDIYMGLSGNPDLQF